MKNAYEDRDHLIETINVVKDGLDSFQVMTALDDRIFRIDYLECSTWFEWTVMLGNHKHADHSFANIETNMYFTPLTVTIYKYRVNNVRPSEYYKFSKWNFTNNQTNYEFDVYEAEDVCKILTIFLEYLN